MSTKDPFAEPDDAERTVIKPNPGGRRTAAVQAQAAPQMPPPPGAAPAGGGAAYGLPQAEAPRTASPARSAEATISASMTGMNQMNACAATLFSLVSRIRNRAQHMDPDALRRNVVAEVRGFEARALQAGIDPNNLKVARYAICATLDDVVLNTPWGEQSVWAQQSMVGTFHRETVGGDRFYDLLARLEQEPGRNIDLLEFLYMCLSLGFEGRLRVEHGGSDKHLQIRNGLARIIRAQRGPVEQDLSPHWPGLDKPHRALSAWKPVWITTGIMALVMALGFAGLSYALGRSSERLLGQLSALDTGVMPELVREAPPPPPPIITEEQLDKVKEFLKAEIDEGLVTVFQDANTITIRIAGKGMFGSGSDALKDGFNVPLGRVAEALNDAPGPILVAGHSDNQPISSARFPSNMALSLARAESVAKSISGKLKDPGRIKAEGRAEKEPIADNGTAEGRAANRRIEIILLKAAT